MTMGATSVDVNIGVGVSGSVVKFGTGSITIESDYGVGAPVLALTDTGSGNGGSIEFGINSLSIGTNTGNISIYAPAGNITATGNSIRLNGGITYVKTLFKSENYNAVANDYSIVFNSTDLTTVLPLVDDDTVGRVLLITNINETDLTVKSTDAQLIYSNQGPSSATTRSLNMGHSQLFTGIQTSDTPTYGWSMI
jgi:hypothetical protein